MQRKVPQLAKFTRPRIFDAIARERLFSLIDESIRTRPVTWIESPPGAGKTTLVASYLEARNLGGIWFQVDAGDADPSTFFYYLGLAERALPTHSRRRSPLPLLTAELLGDVPGFARRFFRELFSRLAPGSVVVFDNFQEASDTAAVHEALVAGMDEIPPGIQLIVVSRAGTPPHYARLNAHRAVKVIDWDALRFTPEETQRLLASSHADLPPDLADTLHEQTGGWVVGLVLLAEQVRRERMTAGLIDADSLQQVFAYFAGQIFDRASPSDQRTLLRLSFLASLDESIACELTDDPDTPRLLERLYRRHLFTDRRRVGAETYYQFHALFRAFLQDRARAGLTPDEYRSTARHAADLLASRGRADEAMPLYLAGGDEAGAEALVLGESAALLAQGRWKVVVEWIRSLPSERLHTNPWLLHWLGLAQTGVDPAHARDVLARAHRRAAALGDVRCQVQAAAGVIETLFLEYADFMPVDPWIPVLDRILEPGFDFGSLDEELRAQSALLIAATYRMPDHPGIERCAQRTLALLDTGADLNLRVTAATYVTLHGAFTGDVDFSRRGARRLVPMLVDSSVTIFRRVFAWAVLLWYAANASDTEVGDQGTAELDAIARDEGFHLAERFACIIGFYYDMDRRDHASGRRRIARFQEIFIREQPYEAASIVNMKAYEGVFTGDASLTLRYGPEACELYELAGSIPHILVGLSGMVWAAVEAGHPEQAHWIERHRRYSSRRNMRFYEWVLDAAGAVNAMRRHDEAATRLALETVFGDAHDLRQGYGHMMCWSRAWASMLADAALVRGIHAGRVRDFIGIHALEPPEGASPEWPWPVRIQALGQFVIHVNGEVLTFRGKVPRKPLAVLKLLVTGAPTGVRDTVLLDLLWPDEDGDSARDAFRVALHRLRRLLGDADAVQIEDGLVRLDSARCHVDAHRLRAVLGAPVPADAVARRAQLHRLCALYTGDLLAGEDDMLSFDAARTQLSGDFDRRAIDLLGADLSEVPDDWVRTARSAFDRRPGSPRLAEFLMRTLLGCGRADAALAIHDRFVESHRNASGAAADEAILRTLRVAARDALANVSARRQASERDR